VATQYASALCKLTISSHLFARWHLFQHVGHLRHQQQVDFRPFDLKSGVRVTCDVGYLCANFSLPRPLCSRVMSDVRDRQTSDRRQTKTSLNASALWGRRHNKEVICHGTCAWTSTCTMTAHVLVSTNKEGPFTLAIRQNRRSIVGLFYGVTEMDFYDAFPRNTFPF